MNRFKHSIEILKHRVKEIERANKMYSHSLEYLSELQTELSELEGMDKVDEVTRFEVIDDRIGRVHVVHNRKVELSYQDDNRTLKVFITN